MNQRANDGDCVIDALRAFSLVCVVTYHLVPTFLPFGYLGVSIFFLLSGYLVQIGFSNSDANIYLLKRVFRLLPNFVLITTPLLFFSVAIPTGVFYPEASLLRAVSNLYIDTFFINSTGYFNPAERYNPFLHLWSVSVEIKFYFILYLVANLRLLCVVSHQRILALLITIGLCSFCFDYYSNAVNPSRAYFDFLCRGWEFISGAILAMIVKRSWHRNSPKALPLLLFAAMAYVMMHDLSISFIYRKIIVLFIVAAAIYFGGLKTNSAVRWVSNRTYQIYLIHYPLIIFHELDLISKLKGFVVFVIAILFAEFGDQIRRNGAYLLLKVLASLVILNAVTEIRIANGSQSKNISYTRNDSKSDWRYGECFIDNVRQTFSDSCLSSKAKFLLVGDSHVAQLVPYFDAVYGRSSYSLLAYGGCLPFLEDNVTGCSEPIRKHLDSIELLPSTTVIYSVRFSYHRIEEILHSFSLLRRRFKDNPVFIIFNPLSFPFPPQAYFFSNRRHFSSNLPVVISQGTFRSLDKDVIATILESAIRYDFTVVDLSKSLCVDGQCTVGEYGNLFFVDDSHLSASGVNYLLENVKLER